MSSAYRRFHGSSVGNLCAIDQLASWTVDGAVVRPKVVASTATVRRAAEQVFALFDRKLKVFPSPLLDVEHAFFAEQRPVSDEHPGRQYLGICPSTSCSPPA